MLEDERTPENESNQVTNITVSDVGDIHAEMVRMHQSDAETITAEEVELRQSAAANVKANVINANQCH